LVSELSPGTAATIELWRKGKTKTITMNVGEMKVAIAKGKTSGTNVPEHAELGLSLRPLTPEERKQADVQGGLLVENVTDGPAARAGVRAGDVILSVNGENTGSIQQLRSLVDKSGKRIAILIKRDEQQLFVPINLG